MLAVANPHDGETEMTMDKFADHMVVDDRDWAVMFGNHALMNTPKVERDRPVADVACLPADHCIVVHVTQKGSDAKAPIAPA